MGERDFPLCPTITLPAMHVHRPSPPPLAPACCRNNIGRIGPARDLGRPEAGACRPCVRAPVPPGGAPPAARRRRPPWGSTSPCRGCPVLLGCEIRPNSLRGPRKSAARRLPGPPTTQHTWGELRGRRSRSHRTKRGHGVLERLTCEVLVSTGDSRATDGESSAKFGRFRRDEHGRPLCSCTPGIRSAF